MCADGRARLHAGDGPSSCISSCWVAGLLRGEEAGHCRGACEEGGGDEQDGGGLGGAGAGANWRRYQAWTSVRLAGLRRRVMVRTWAARALATARAAVITVAAARSRAAVLG